MSSDDQRERAARPEDLGRFFVDRANAGDVEGLVALYEPGAVLAMPNGAAAVTGTEAIRGFHQKLLAGGPAFSAVEQRAPLVNGELALTSTRIPSGATAEVARLQPDGTWLWIIDQPRIVG